MRNRIASSPIILSAVMMALTVGGKVAGAQQGPGHSMSIVVHADRRAISPPLRNIPPIPTDVLSNLSLRLLHPHPLSGVRTMLPDPALQTSVSPSVATTSGANFIGVGEGLGSFNVRYAPPDTNGAVGPTEYVQWVNVNFAVFAKYNNETINGKTYNAGQVVYGPAAGNTLWSAIGGSCASSNSGDPIAQFDKQAGRWVMLQPVFSSPYALCVAVSQTSDATGAYNLYSFSIPSNYFPDYPKLGVWPDGYYVSYNEFNSAGTLFYGAAACALDRTSMLQGKAATMQCFLPGTAAYSLLPSDLDGDSGAAGTTDAPPPGTPNYFVQLNTTSSLAMWKFHVDWTNSANSTLTGPVAITVPSYSEACGGGTCVPQYGTTELLDSLGDRMMYRLAYRNEGGNETLVAAHSVNTGSSNTGVRWYEIQGLSGTPAVTQASTYAPDASYRWMPSIGMDKFSDIALGYSVSSGSMYPAVRYTGRLASDALNTMESENGIVEGGGAQLTNLSRWGDYSSVAVDPVDDCTFWYTNEYLLSSGTFNWSTQIGSFNFAGCGNSSYSVTASAALQSIVQGTSASYALSVSPLNGYTGTVNLSAVGLPSGATPTFTNTSVPGTGGSSTLSISIDGTVSPGTYNFTVQGNDGSSTSLTPLILVVTSSAGPDFSILATPSSQTVTQGSGTSYGITVTASGGFSGAVGFSVAGLPSGASASFSPNSVTGSGSSTMSVTTSSSTPQGTYTLTITGTSGNLTHSVTVSLQVNAATSGTFSLGASASTITVAINSSTSDIITVSPSGGFTGSVSLSLSGLPPRTSSSFSINPASITGTSSATSTLTISANRKATAGTYNLTLTATSGSLTQSIPLTLIVGSTSSPDFSVSASPSSQTIAPGSNTSYAVSVTASGGFTGTVGFSVGGLPSGASGSFSPTSVSGSGSGTLSITTSSSAATGTYSLTITGTSGSLIRSAAVTLVVSTSTSADFSLSASPSSLAVSAGSSVSYTVTVGSLNGFTGTVALSAASLPPHATASFSPSSVTGSGNSTMAISMSRATKANTYTVTIAGSSGSLSHSTSVQLVVQ